MPLTKVVIEDVGQAAPAEARWLCEMETGQSGTFRTVHFRAGSFNAILKMVRDAYRGETSPADLAAAREVKVEAAAVAAAEAEAQAAEPADEAPDVEALRAHAEELGVDVDRRWGVARLQTEIDKASHPVKPHHARPVALVSARSGVPVGPPPDEPPPDKAA